MIVFHRIVLYGLAIALMAGCGHTNKTPQHARQINSPFNGRGPLLNFYETDTILLPDDEPYEFEKYGTIDFFGVKLVGSIRQVIDSIDSLPFIDIENIDNLKYKLYQDDESITRFGAKVIIDNIPFNMNIEYLKTDTEVVDQLYFITYNTSQTICDTIVERLCQYYDLPDIIDTDEDSYAWFIKLDFYIRFRHLHYDYGGWTFYLVR